MFKVARKGSRVTLSKIIDSGKDIKVLRDFFIRLQRDFAHKTYAHEASLIAEFWAQTTEVYELDVARLYEYLRAYFEKHAGLGLPVPLDQALVVRLMGGKGGASASDLADLRKESAKKETKMESRLDALEARAKKLENENSRLRSELKKAGDQNGEDGDETPGAFAKGGKKKNGKKLTGECFKCGKRGHNAADCPGVEEEE